MKERTISAVVVLAIAIPLFIMGGLAFEIAIFVLALLGLKEFMDVKESRKPLPQFVKFISYLFMILLIATNIESTTPLMQLDMDYRIISALVLSFLVPTVLYHEKKKFSIKDAFYMMGGIFFLAVSFILLINVRASSLALIVYIFSITIMTDTFAYITGLLIGRHKLLEPISPKKTWEGSIGGTIAGTLVSTVFYITVINPLANPIRLALIGIFLSIIGQFGDLVFSAIKRDYGKKDFSNIMPGHGGVLDRLDSVIFVLLGFMFIIPFL